MDRKSIVEKLESIQGGIMNTLYQGESMSNRNAFFDEVRSIVSDQDVVADGLEKGKSEINTLSVNHKVLGVIYPRTVSHVQAIVKLANKYKIALYPISQGRNIGYGEMTPYKVDQIVLNLSYLDKIRFFDSAAGEIIVEPGVTQQELANFLKSIQATFWADVTGASPLASVLGNTLEGGFGHTPMGNHRKHLVEVEAVLSDGSLVNTGEVPALGA